MSKPCPARQGSPASSRTPAGQHHRHALRCEHPAWVHGHAHLPPAKELRGHGAHLHQAITVCKTNQRDNTPQTLLQNDPSFIKSIVRSPEKIQLMPLLRSRKNYTEWKGERPPPSGNAFSTLLYQDVCDAKYQFHGVSFELMVNISDIPPIPTGTRSGKLRPQHVLSPASLCTTLHAGLAPPR